jgi:hypothetical protein
MAGTSEIQTHELNDKATDKPVRLRGATPVAWNRIGDEAIQQITKIND